MAEQDIQSMPMPVTSAGKRLADARKAAGLSRGDLAERTRIAERYLAAIEEGRFSDLASRAYAVGFSRAYARAVGLDEEAIVLAVREELAASEDEGQAQKTAAFEPGDPARVPGVSLVGLATLGALLVVVLVFVFWRSYYVPSVSLPDLTREEEAAPPATAASSAPTESGEAAADAVPAADAPVVFTALAPDVWVKFYDGSGRQLMQKQMAQGESYTVPADAEAPRIWTGRPDALRITIGGKEVSPLSERQVTMKDVPVSAAALLARTPQEGGAGHGGVSAPVAPSRPAAPVASGPLPAQPPAAAKPQAASLKAPSATASSPLAPSTSARPSAAKSPATAKPAPSQPPLAVATATPAPKVAKPSPSPSAAPVLREPVAASPAPAEASTVSQ